jgi:hypothetical protein
LKYKNKEWNYQDIRYSRNIQLQGKKESAQNFINGDIILPEQVRIIDQEYPSLHCKK